MAIPSRGEIYRPLLEHLSQAQRPMKLAFVVRDLADHFAVTKEEQQERTPGGRKRFAGRVNMVAMKLKSIGFLKSPRYGFLQITRTGRKKLQDPEIQFDRKTVKRPLYNQNNNSDKFIEMTSQIVAAYVIKNTVPSEQLPAIIKSTHAALLELRQISPEQYFEKHELPSDYPMELPIHAETSSEPVKDAGGEE